jgi:A/G-specific adenine glycosylase
LYCFPLFDDLPTLEAAVPARYRTDLEACVVVKHVLTHKDLYLHPVKVQLPSSSMKAGGGVWAKPDQWSEMGLPAPIRKLLVSPP